MSRLLLMLVKVGIRFFTTGFYKQADGQTKRKILGGIFSEKLVLEKGRVAIMSFTEPGQVLFKISKVLQGLKIKKRLNSTSCLLWLARLPEFSGEPATHGLIPGTRDCSNQEHS